MDDFFGDEAQDMFKAYLPVEQDSQTAAEKTTRSFEGDEFEYIQEMSETIALRASKKRKVEKQKSVKMGKLKVS